MGTGGVHGGSKPATELQSRTYGGPGPFLTPRAIALQAFPRTESTLNFATFEMSNVRDSRSSEMPFTDRYCVMLIVERATNCDRDDTSSKVVRILRHCSMKFRECVLL